MYLQRWHGWCHMKLLPSRRVLRTPYNHAPCHFMQSHIRKVYAYPATCTFGRMTGCVFYVLRGWNGYRNKSQHRRKFSRRSCRDSNPRPFDQESGALTTELSTVVVVVVVGGGGLLNEVVIIICCCLNAFNNPLPRPPGL